MLKVRIEKESEDDLAQQILETLAFTKEDESKSLKSENDVWYVVMGGSDESTVNRRRCAGQLPVQNLGEAFSHRYVGV